TLIGIIKNDTLYREYIPALKLRPYPVFINIMDSVVIEGFNHEMYVIKTGDWIKYKEGIIPKNISKIDCGYNLHLMLQTAIINGQFAGKYIYFGKGKSNSIRFYNYKTNTTHTINLSNRNNEQLVHGY